MNYKKLGVYAFLFLMLSVSFVLAENGLPQGNATNDKNYQINTIAQLSEGFITGVITTFSPITKVLFGEDKSAGNSGFIAFMAFALTLLVIFGVLKPLKFFGEGDSGGWINFAIAFILATIGVRFIPIEMLNSFTLGSQGLVGAIFLIIPFIVVSALILKAENTYVKKGLGITYGIIILILWLKAQQSNTGEVNWYWLYPLILFGIVVLLLFEKLINKIKNNYSNRNIIKNIEQGGEDSTLSKIDELERAQQVAKQAGETVRADAIGRRINNLKRSLTRPS